MTGNNPEVHVFHTVGWYSVVHSFNPESVQKASSIELIMSSKPFYMAAVHQNSHCKLEYYIINMTSFLGHDDLYQLTSARFGVELERQGDET